MGRMPLTDSEQTDRGIAGLKNFVQRVLQSRVVQNAVHRSESHWVLANQQFHISRYALTE